MKCGTTVLWHNLNKHPGINMCKNWGDPKIASTEIRFWNDGRPHRTWSKGINWYKGLFSGECCGEKSANYIEYRAAIQRMSQYIPNLKLILCIRDPITRAYSEFQMHRSKRKNVEFSMEHAQQTNYLARGSYFTMIKNNVLKFFPKENLYIVIQERMKNDTDGELAKLCKFLGVAAHHMGVQKVASSEATDRNLDLNKDGKVASYKKWRTKYPPMSDKMCRALIDFYIPHNRELFNFLGDEIPEWSKK